MDAKKVSESKTEQIQMVMAEDINGYGRLFGGRLMQWIDIVGGVVARRHANMNATTASVDDLQFKAAAYVNEMIVLNGQVTYVGKTSMEIRVEAYVEHLNGSRSMINRAYMVYVALDKNENPTSVPRLTPETEEEKAEWEAGEKRAKLRKERKEMGY
ncbi:MAG: acyl-CoA thioesterase [Anaerofustis sp.]